MQTHELVHSFSIIYLKVPIWAAYNNYEDCLHRRSADMDLYRHLDRQGAGSWKFSSSTHSRTLIPVPRSDQTQAMTSHPQLTLTYFDGTGRAELTRLIFAYGVVEFHDKRVKEDFPALKPTLPLGQLPVLQVDGTTYSQSMAIARYAAKLSGLYPQDPLQALTVDMISETFMDLMVAVIDYSYMEKDATAKEAKTKKFACETLPKAFGLLETMIQGKFFLGDSPAYADLQLFDVVENGLKVMVPDLQYMAYPKLTALIENVRTITPIAAYLAKQTK